MTTGSSDFRAALRLIHERSNYERGYITNPRSGPAGPELGLRRTRALLDALGAPDRAFPVIHVAGSKGKGSTSAFAAAIGTAAGYRTGLSTSPHLHSFRERIAIDGIPIDEQTFAQLAFECSETIDALEGARPELGAVTAFELLTVMALLAFAESTCNLALIEVGLGGTFDATNVITPAVSIITRLDLEHTQILGDTLASIAANKAGIIKPGIPVVIARQDTEALQVIEEAARIRQAPLLVAGREFRTRGSWRSFAWIGAGHAIDRLRSGMAGQHQLENASLAIAAWEQLQPHGLVASDEAIRVGLCSAALPGRFERIDVDGRTWILDGAHTPVAAEALALELLDELGRPVPAIAGFLSDKHPAAFLEALTPAVSELILTAPRNPRALPTKELTPIARTAISQVISSQDLETSMHLARVRTAPQTPILITGSLVLVAEARELLGLALADPAPPEVGNPEITLNSDRVD